MEITFYGHATFRVITPAGVKILLDPWLSNPQAPQEVDRGPYDLILITHAHGDHLGEVLEVAGEAEVVAIHEIQQWLAARGVPKATGMNIGGTYATRGLKITMVPAFHSSSFPDGTYGGEPCGFVIEMEDGRRLYHAGDTGLFAEMTFIGELYPPEVALLPIGSHYVMSPREAAKACELLQPKVVIPMHYGTFPVLYGTPEDLERELAARGLSVEVKVLSPGETVRL
ncbi:MAG: metal-dependent hydrolase [Thermodesulfatator sp.]|nr:MAG: metal-dependent hydrolase [Thermodesulfatator sp.]